jgi:hypothetical protein
LLSSNQAEITTFRLTLKLLNFDAVRFPNPDTA